MQINLRVRNTSTIAQLVHYVAVQNDGIVPWSTSAYPGGTAITMPRALFGDLAHTLQTADLTMTAEVSARLRQFMNVALRPPPVSVFSASISGASIVPPGQLCNYAPIVANGVSPFTYEWYAGNVLVGTGQYLGLTVNDPGIALSLVVRDATNAVASAQLSIATDLFSSGCF